MGDKDMKSRVVGDGEIPGEVVDKASRELGPVVAEIVHGRDDHPMDDDHVVLMGGDPSDPTWEEYIAEYNDDFRPCLEAVRRAIEAAGIVGVTADRFCNDNYFRLSNGRTVSFSWRAWGDLMQAIVGKREGYMAYYMR